MQIPRQMRAAVVTAPQQVKLDSIAIPEPAANALRVRLEGCGVCGSNLPPWEGRPWFNYPLAPGELGHEGWGVVDAVGPEVQRFSPGDRVALLSYRAYAEFDVALETAVVALPPSIGRQPFPGEALGCAMNVFQRCAISAGQHVAVVGIGFLGTVLTALAANAGAQVTAITRRPYGLEVARQLGAKHLIAFGDHAKVVSQVREITGGVFCDRVLEATGLQEPLDLAAQITRERGRLIIAGYHQDGLRQVNLQLWNWRGLDVINAHERDPQIYLEGMQRAVQAVANGRFDPTPLYTHRFPLEELGAALEMMRNRPENFLKAIIEM